MTTATPYFVPREPGRWRAIALAAVVHAALLALLWVGVRWQNDTPTTIEAEVWSPQTRDAAPRPQPEPEVKPEPKPPVKEIPKPVVTEPPVVKPDIALEQEKKRKAHEQKQRDEQEKRERLAKQKADEQRVEKEKIDMAAKKKREAEDLNKEAADKKRKQDAADAQKLAKVRDEEMRRITGGLTGTGGSGDAPKSQGSRGDGSYAAKVGAKIKSNIIFNVPDDLIGNPPVEYEVDLLPDGAVAGMKKTKSSGVPGFDDAVKRAIEKSQPYPKDKSGSVPTSFIGSHKPKD